MDKYITGYKGYVGSELVKRGFIPLECDITNYEEVEKAVSKVSGAVLHLAGKSDVDYCELKRNQEEVTKVNVRGTYYLFENLAKAQIPGVYLSTDQIWRGGLFEKHREDSKNTPPVNFYGMTKVAAEAVVDSFKGKIVRTSYLFDSKRLEDKIHDMKIGLVKKYPVFIKRSFLHLHDFCDMLEVYCDKFYKLPKILHLSGSRRVSWYAFMKEFEKQYVMREGSIKPRFFNNKNLTPRPWFGGLDNSLSYAKGFPRIDYIRGIERMRSES